MKIKYEIKGQEKTVKAYYCRRNKVPDVDLFSTASFGDHDFSIYRSYRKIYNGSGGWYLYLKYNDRWWYVNDKDFYFDFWANEYLKLAFEDVPSWEKTEGKPRRRSTTLEVDKVLVAAKTIKEGSELADKNNDCTVLAVAHAFGVPYDTAYKFLRDLGREPNKGFRLVLHLLSWANTRKVIFDKVVNIEPFKRPMTMGTFVKSHPRGTYILSISGHVNTLKDGKLIDHSLTARSKLFNAFEIV